jgi:predicted permease
VAFVAAASLGAGVLAGIAPAWSASRTQPAELTAAGGGHQIAGSRRLTRGLGLLVGTQLAMSAVLVVGAGLLLRSVLAAEAFDPGFETRNLLLATVDLRRPGYDEDRGRAFRRQLLERAAALPGARSATAALVVPLGPDRESQGFEIEGAPPPPGRPVHMLPVNLVEPGYFAAMGIPLARGRDFSVAEGAPEAVVNEAFVARFWPGQDPLGKTLAFSGSGVPPLRVVGVARNIAYYTPGEAPGPYVYGPLRLIYAPRFTVQVRTAGEARLLAAPLRSELARLDPRLRPEEVRTFEDLRRAPLYPAIALAAISSALGAAAVALSAVGLFGVLSLAVGRRTRELGVRAALGATAGDLLRLVLLQGMRPALAGMAAGLVASAAVARLLGGYLFGVGPFDARTFAAASALLVATAFLACLLPARRAARAAPMTSLRSE